MAAGNGHYAKLEAAIPKQRKIKDQSIMNRETKE